MTKERFPDVSFDLDFETVPQEIMEWAKENIGENDKDIKIYEFREMIYERGDVVPPRNDDVHLLKFLRARNFNLESSYRLLVNYYNFKEENPELYENVDLSKIKFVGDEDVIEVVPYREESGRRIMIYKLGNWKPDKHSMEELFISTLAILELGCLEPRAQILGGICIFDMANITIKHVWQITPNVAKKIIEIMVTSFPLKISAVHIIFESRVFDMLYKLFKPLISQKMKKKIFFHGSNVSSLHKHINPKTLPKRYGGLRPNYRYNRWIETFRKSPKMITELRSLGFILPQHVLNTKFTNSDDEKSDEELE